MVKKLGLGNLLLLLVAVIVLLSFLPVIAAKPQPQPPPYVEPTGNLAMTSAPQLETRAAGYIRVYDWANGAFSHIWSGITGDNTNIRYGTIGDVDNDGTKEVVSFNAVQTALKGNRYSTTYNFKIWNNGDASNSPSITKVISGVVEFAEIGDVDNDGKNELVYTFGATDIEVWSCTASDCTREALINNIGMGTITIADADNDGKNELLVGMGDFSVKNYYCHGVVVKYDSTAGTYSVVGDLGPANTQCCIDEISVGNIDGNAGNEIFGSGRCGGNIYVWRYSNNAYSQVWTTQNCAGFNQNNEIADVNGDGTKDIVFASLCDITGYNSMFVYKNSGTDTWTKLGEYSGAKDLQDAMYSADLDSDGKAEIVNQDLIWDWDGSAMKLIQTLAGGPIYSCSMA